MNIKDFSFEVNNVEGINYISHQSEKIHIGKGRIESIHSIKKSKEELSFLGPGLIDLQVNGVNGIDFNNAALTSEDVLEATKYLLQKGVTTYLPAIITNSGKIILKILATIRLACESYPLVNSCIGGIHLEGPFISQMEGFRGAHPKKYIKEPDWGLICAFQEESGGRIKLITLAPELAESSKFIKRCRLEGILVAIGHSNATSKEIDSAVKAGATLSTHLGNGVSPMLPRHPNLLWEQLANDKLFGSIIADGFHLPDSFLKVVIRMKGDKLLLISDVTSFSGMAPGLYETHIGGKVILEKEGMLVMKESPNLLAGASKTLLEDIQYLGNQNIVSYGTAWKMGSINPARFLGKKCYGLIPGGEADIVLFSVVRGKTIKIVKVIKKGQVVFENTQGFDQHPAF